MSLNIQAAALIGALVSTVSAHGTVQGIVAGGTYYQGYSPSFQYQSPPPSVAGWSVPEDLDNGFVDPTMYTENSKIACHKDATVGQAQVTVAAGDKVTLEWTTWPDSHKGPVLDYLSAVDGDFTSATYDSLSFVKIDESGYDGTTWASDTLIANNNSWTVTIPSSIAAGNYVLRHEIIALHSAGTEDGAQNYPQCINLKVTGGGSATVSGVAADTFYTPTDPGILINIYTTLTNYTIPGPALWSGASSGDDNPSTPAASSAAVALSSAAISSAVTTSAPVAASSVVGSSVASSAVVSNSVLLTQVVQSTSITPIVTAVPSVTSDAAASLISQLVTGIPSGLLTSVLPTAIPTSAANISGPLPTTPLPEGITLKDLLDWVAYILRNFGRKGGRGRNDRQHARAFN